MATAFGDRIGTGNSNLLWAEEETHLICSFQLGVKLAEDLLQLFPDHIGKNIQASPVKARPCWQPAVPAGHRVPMVICYSPPSRRGGATTPLLL